MGKLDVSWVLDLQREVPDPWTIYKIKHSTIQMLKNGRVYIFALSEYIK